MNTPYVILGGKKIEAMDEVTDILRRKEGIQIERVLKGGVVVAFDGGAEALRMLLAETAWREAHIGIVRTYRLA